ncbi:MAG: T9SS type A sorting domain-containing protein, partial [Bacteroidetes bacterium]|nr:T9SS type A sorting domain-containing protein [Bacteroidota bacterium]
KGNFRLDIYDITGRITTKFTSRSNNFGVDASSLPSGIYMFQLYCNDRLIESAKLQIE